MFREKNIVLGIIAAGVLAFISRGLVNLSGISYISPSVLALILGIILNNFRKKGDILENGLQFSAKKILKLGIIFLGASMNISIILSVGKIAFLIMIFTFTISYGLGYLLRRKINLTGKFQLYYQQE